MPESSKVLRRRVWLPLLLFFITLGVDRASEVKLGILCTDTPGDALADLLTVELSHREGITVLERTELDRIVREHSLNRFSSAELLKAGALAGVDGLVILGPRKVSRGVSLNLRVVGVRHGVAFGWWDYTVLPERAANWAKGAALQITELIPKLTSSERQAIPISFVGFTSPTSSRDSMLLEREINNLFLKRLGAEPVLVVLERQKLLESAFEKVLNSDDRKFWNGACLLDGTINPEGISEGSLTAHFRLVGPEGRIVGESMLRGSRTNLAKLGAEFVGQVRRLLNSGGSVVTWNASTEAKRFYDEAGLAVRWGFWPEARDAVDASLALGKDDPDTQRLRLQAYTGWLDANQISTVYQASYKPDYGILENYTAPPPRESLDIAFNIAGQLQDAVRSPTNVFNAENQQSVVKEAIQAIGWVTLKYYVGAELRQGNEVKLADLRASMRKVTSALIEANETQQIYFLGPGPNDPNSSKRMRKVTDVLLVMLKFGPLWQETPEDGVKLHRRLRATLNYEILKKGLDNWIPSFDWTPSLCGWIPADRLRVDKVSASFGEENRLLEQARFRLLAIPNSQSDSELVANCQAAMGYFSSNYDRFTGTGYQTSFLPEFERGWHWQEDLVASDVRNGLLSNEVARLERLLTGIDKATATHSFRLVQSYPLPANRLLDRISLCLARKQIPAADLLMHPVYGIKESEIEKITEALNQVRQLPDSSEKQAILPAVDRLISALAGRKRMAEMRRGVARPPPNSAEGLKIPVEYRVVPLTTILGLGTSIGLQPTRLAGSIAAKFLPLPAAPQVDSVLWADGKLWLGYILRRQEQFAIGNDGGGVRIVHDGWFGSLDPTSGLFEQVQVPSKFFPPFVTELPDYAVFSNRVVFFFPEQAVIYDRITKEFASMSSPLKSAHRLQVGQRLLIYNNESILETTGDLSEFRVLASVRRRPALSVLDNLNTFGNARLLSAGLRDVYLLLTNKLYRLEHNQWQPLLESESPPTITALSGEFFLREKAHIDEKLNRIRILYFGPSAPGGELWWSALEVPNPPFPWPWQGRLVPAPPEAGGKRRFFPTSGELLLLAGRLLTLSFPQTTANPSLNYWDPNRASPLVFIPDGSERHFEGNLNAFPGPVLPRNYSYCGGGDIFIWNSAVPGIWRIDGSNLLTRVEDISNRDENRLKEQERRMAAILTLYDTNRNRRLDPEEYPALAKEPALFNLVWSELDQNQNNMIDREEINWFDFNHDGKLDSVEYQAFLNAVSFAASAVFLSLDREQEGALPESVTTTYAHGISFAPGIFKKYDANGDGRLDPKEWTALYIELLHRRLAATAVQKSSNSPTAALTHGAYLLPPHLLEQFLGPASQSMNHGAP